MVTYDSIRKNEAVNTYIKKADEALVCLGFTEHSFAHVGMVASGCRYILETLDFPARTIELAQIAAYLHDIGNLVNRVDHSQSGAVMAFRILDKLGMDPEEIAEVVAAIGNHDEGTGTPVSPMAAALILADKSDVRRSRVRNKENTAFDIHDRVNYAVEKSSLILNRSAGTISLILSIDTSICAVMDYFEIFLTRMMLSKRAAEYLGLSFKLEINGTQFL